MTSPTGSCQNSKGITMAFSIVWIKPLFVLQFTLNKTFAIVNNDPMMLHPRPQSLAEVARVGRDAETFSFAIRNFLDEFYADPAARRLEEEPRFLVSVLQDEGLADAY